jgi:hypothetical protein
MSLGLIKPGRRSANLAGKFNPRTWLPLEPIGELKDGTVLWPVMGAADPSDDPDDPAYAGGTEDDDQDDDEEDEEEDKPKSKRRKKVVKKDDDEDDDEEEEEEDKPSRPERQAARYRTQLRASQKENAALAARLKAIEDKDKPADEVKAREAQEATTRADKAAGVVRQVRLENAFLRSNDVNWIDPTDAFRLIDLEEVDVDDDGMVDEQQLRRALRALAKKKPHLVKPKTTRGQDDDEDDDDEEPRSSRTASTMNGRRRGKNTGADRAALAKKFPVLGNL